MTTITLEKPKRKQDRKIIEAIREESGHRCEYVDPETGLRCRQPAPGEPHHIRTRGAGGKDIRENQIHLCGMHHTGFHDGNIDRHFLIWVVAKREKKSIEEIYETLGLQMPKNPPEIKKTEEIPSIEELIQAYIQVDESEQETRWTKGQLLDAMLSDESITQKWLSSQLGVSPAQIRELVKVYRTFPNDSTRIPSLSWYHHRVAANSDDPVKYITQANDQEWSTREMREAILRSESKEHIAEQEEDKEMRKAKTVFGKIEKIIHQGGEPARWLKEKLNELVA